MLRNTPCPSGPWTTGFLINTKLSPTVHNGHDLLEPYSWASGSATHPTIMMSLLVYVADGLSSRRHEQQDGRVRNNVGPRRVGGRLRTASCSHTARWRRSAGSGVREGAPAPAAGTVGCPRRSGGSDNPTRGRINCGRDRSSSPGDTRSAPRRVRSSNAGCCCPAWKPSARPRGRWRCTG